MIDSSASSLKIPVQGLQVAVIGIGLIGGSLIKALRAMNAEIDLIGVDTDVESIDSALQSKMINTGFGSVDELLQSNAHFDIVFVCIQPSKTMDISLKLLKNTDAIVTDVASTKNFLYQLEQQASQSEWDRFVPVHPIAGTENSGFSASFGELFAGATVVICDTPMSNVELNQSRRQNINSIASIWQAMGSKISHMAVDEHNKIFSALSHFPHVVAWLTLQTMHKSTNSADDISKYAQGGGLKSLTRLASSDPNLWTDIFITNKENIKQNLDEFIKELLAFKDLLDKSDQSEILKTLLELQSIRRDIWKVDEKTQNENLFVTD